MAALNHFIPQPLLILGVAPTLVQDLAIGLIELHVFHMGPHLKLFQVSLDGTPSIKCVEHATQLGVVCIHGEGALDPAVFVIDEDIKQNWSQHGPLRTPLITHLHVDIELLITNLWMLSSNKFLIH